MSMDVVAVRAEDFGLELEKAKEIELGFAPAIERLNNLKPEYDTIIQKDITPEVCEEAKSIRLKFVKVRTDTARIHKALKAYYLAVGRFVDAWKNKQTEISEQVESRLRDIEEHYERIEAAKKEERKVERMKQLAAVENTGEGLDVLNMDETVWNTVLTGLQSEYAARKEAERRAREEEERKEAERIAEQKRIREENERLKKEREEQERKQAAERAKAEAEKRRLEAQIAKQREEQAKREAAERAKAEAEKRAKEKLERAGDKEKIVAYFSALGDRPEVKDKELSRKLDAIMTMIEEIGK